MADTQTRFFIARTLNELLYQIKTIKDLRIVGGTTYCKELGSKALSISNIAELSEIKKHERYIDFGPAVTLGRILSLGKAHLPQVLYNALLDIGNPFVRNIATIGGNLCNKEPKLSLYAPLLALDTTIECKSSNNKSVYKNLQNFQGVPEGYALTNIRVLLDDWDVSLYYRLGPLNKIDATSGVFVFLADSEKSIISNIRIAFTSSISLRLTDLENKLLGLRLPLEIKNIITYTKEAAITYDKVVANKKMPPLLRQQFLNLVQYSLEQLT